MNHPTRFTGKHPRHPAVVRILVAAAAMAISSLTASRAEQPAVPEFPRRMVEFSPYEHNPIFTARGKGFWDERIRERGWIIRDENVWRMWYTGYEPQGRMKLGYATSSDGLHWKRHGDKPLYDQHWVEDMMVVRQNGKYYMFAEGQNDRAHLLTSNNGIDWSREFTLEIVQVNGEPISEGPYGTPTAWFADGKWHLLYERRDAGVWLAMSTDLKKWTNSQDEPVLCPGPGEYDRTRIAVNQVVPCEGRYYVYYHGQGEPGASWTTNIAVSTDLRNWTKYKKNPLLPVASNKSSGIVIDDGENLRLYTMHPEVHVHFATP